MEASCLATLPGPQRHALEVALLREEPTGEPATQRVIGAAVRSLLAALSVTSSVLVALDDAQWLDRASVHVLEFALRRLEDCTVAALATLRTGAAASSMAPA